MTESHQPLTRRELRGRPPASASKTPRAQRSGLDGFRNLGPAKDSDFRHFDEVESTSVKRGRRSVRRFATRPAPSLKRSAPRQPGQKAGQQLLSMGAMLFAGALLIGTTIPANAFGPVEDSSAELATAMIGGQTETQSVELATGAAAAPISRDGYSVTSYAELLRAEYSRAETTPALTFDATGGAIRWPFPYAVPITDGYGGRAAPCRGCSTFHRGVDFVPGNGTPIYAIADGIVVDPGPSNGTYGNHVMIEHIIHGQIVQSLYAHMQWESSPLTVGSVVRAGDFVGLVGNTGATTAPHLHFEIRVNGEAVDPYAWLQANAS